MRNPKTGKKDKKKKKAKDAAKTGSALVEEEDMMDEEDEEEEEEAGEEVPKVWRPGVDGMDDDEELVYDPTAYDFLHSLRLEWPCLSFDIVRDDLGDKRAAFPHTAFMVAGTQAASSGENCLAVVRMSNLTKMKQPSDMEDDESSDEEDEGGESAPRMHARLVRHHGGINRVRAMPQQPTVVATWGDNGYVQAWDVSTQLQQVAAEARDAAGDAPPAKMAPRHCFTGHQDEGFAMDWSPLTAGRMVTGDCKGAIHLWEPAEGGRWSVDPKAPFVGHGDSVEDLQWSPSEATVFASCSVDGCINVWDTRHPARKAALSVKVHDVDVNVISWSSLASCMVASGADDGRLRIWDLRAFKEGGAVADFSYNQGAITSVEWSPWESSILAASSADNLLCVWDLSVERDAEEEAAVRAAGELQGGAQIAHEDLPPQLMFVHQGQQDIKELHWHPQVLGAIVSTAGDGFNVFKPSNI